MADKRPNVPRLLAGVNLTKLPLSPLEGFVLSRVDGVASVAVLADLTNLAEEQVVTIIARLIELGAIEWARESVSLPRATGREPVRTPIKPFSPPPALRSPSQKVAVPRPSFHPPTPADGSARAAAGGNLYKANAPAEDHVDPKRRSVLTPAASHTGMRMPAGEISEELEALGVADTLPPPAPVPTPFELEEIEPMQPQEELLADDELLIDDEDLLIEEEAPMVEAAAPSAPAPAAKADEGDLDLDPARRKRIDDLYFALDLLDHYQVLGLARDADKGAIRTAYFQLSKVFHPDTMFRKRLGSYKGKMEAIFHRLTEAYEVLGKKRGRDEYDRYLALQDRTRAAEELPLEATALEELAKAAVQREADLAAGRALAAASAAEPAIENVVPDPAPAPPTAEVSEAAPAASQSQSSATQSAAGRARARELMAQKLRSAARASEATRMKAVAGSAPSSAPPTASESRQVLRNLTSAIRDSATQTGGLDQLQRHVHNAKRAEREGDIAAAVREYRLALAIEPEREDLLGEHSRLSARLAATLADSYEEKATYEQQHRRWSAAAVSWAKVFEGRPKDARAARLAAEALIEAKGDLHRAGQLAQRAAELEPDDIDNLRALARVYIAAGLPLNARRVLLRAVELDPSDQIVENLLRNLDK